ncbi:MAG TPA: CBS domain-containing protein [Nocardioides sp.]|nr:CBS domain-containing protein [Nocardioides sp.]
MWTWWTCCSSSAEWHDAVPCCAWSRARISSAASEPVSDAVALLEGADAALVQEDGKPVGVLTRQDLLAFLAKG